MGGRKERKIEIWREGFGRENGGDTGKHKNIDVFQKENSFIQ